MTVDLDGINLTSLEFWRRNDRLEALAELRRQRPISWHEFVEAPERGMRGIWALTRYQDVVAVSRDSRTFISGKSTNMADQSEEEARAEGFFLNMDGDEHFRLRHIVAK